MRHTGLRSQWHKQQEEIATTSVDLAWETVPSSSSSEEHDGEDRPGVALAPTATAPALTGGSGGELLTLMRDVLAGQQREALRIICYVLSALLKHGGGQRLNGHVDSFHCCLGRHWRPTPQWTRRELTAIQTRRKLY